MWSPDGLRIAYLHRGDGKLVGAGDGNLVTKAADGTGQEEVLEEAVKGPTDWTHDGGYLVTMTPPGNPKTGSDIWSLPLSGPDARRAAPLRRTEFLEGYGRVSPDGRWLAYESNETNRFEVYVVGFPSLNGRWQISANGGRSPVWSRDGRELYFIGNGSSLMAVEIKSGAQFQAGIPKPLFDVPLEPASTKYDVSADGRFLIAAPAQSSAKSP